jgi:hypothetical protein
MKMLKTLAATLLVTASVISAGSAQAEQQYVKAPNGYVFPKHECQAGYECIDCTFLDREPCYAKADAAGLINHNVGFGPGQRPPERIAPINPNDPNAGVRSIEQHLESECSNTWRGMLGGESSSFRLPNGKMGQIICPVPGAVAINAPPKPQRSAEPWFPDQDAAGDAAVGIFFAQYCPGYITEDSRQFMHTFLQMKARDATPGYQAIISHIGAAMKANGTSERQEVHAWCVKAEPRVFDIQTKIGQLMK